MRQFALGRRLVVVADPGERLQRAGARLGVVALGVAALADLGRRRDIDLAERGVGDAARRGAIVRRRARPRRRWRCGRCAPDGWRLRRAGECFRCGPAREKPRSPLRPARSVSPSSRIGEPPLLNSRRSSARASVDLPGARQARQPDHRAVVAIARRALVGAQRGFHRHDIDRNGALSGIDRQHEAAAGDAAVDLDHQPSGARIFVIGIGRDRLRQRDVDFADMIARDRLGLRVGEFAGIDGLLDRDHGGAGFPRAEADQDLIALRQRLVVQPENARANSARIARACCRHGR